MHYKTLGISKDASHLEIEAAFSKHMVTYSSNMSNISAAQHQLMVTAYGILSDPIRRKNFDRFGDPAGGPFFVIVPEYFEKYLLNPKISHDIASLLFDAINSLYGPAEASRTVKELKDSEDDFLSQLWHFSKHREIDKTLHVFCVPQIHFPNPKIGFMIGVVFFESGVTDSFVSQNWHFFENSFAGPSNVDVSRVRVVRDVRARYMI